MLASGFAALALWIWDMNKLPLTPIRAVIAWYAAAYQGLTCAAWIVNAAVGSQTGFGRFVQAWQWTGRAAGGLVLAMSVSFAYRRSAAERERKIKLLMLSGG